MNKARFVFKKNKKRAKSLVVYLAPSSIFNKDFQSLNSSSTVVSCDNQIFIIKKKKGDSMDQIIPKI